MSISFNNIPSTIKVPGAYVEFDNTQAMSGATLMEYTALIVGHKLSTGTAENLAEYPVTSVKQAKALFGPGSQAAVMAEAFIKNNSFTRLKVIGVDVEDDAVKAEGRLTFGGTCSGAGSVCLYVGGHVVKCPCHVTTTAVVLATNMAAAINADADCVVTATASSQTVGEEVQGIVTLSAKTAGLTGNAIDLRLGYYGETLPSGITAAVTAMAGGSGAPDVDNIIAALGDNWYHIIAWPWTDRASLLALEAELEDRWGPLRHIDGVAVCSVSGTFSAVQDFGSGVTAGNYAHISIVEDCLSPDLPCARAAAVAGVAAYYGNIDPARPFQTLTLKGCLAPATNQRLTLQEQNLLISAGIATTMVDASGNVAVQRLVTNYLTNASGATDTSYQDVNTLLTLSFLRYDFRARILRKYPRHKLAGDSENIAPGQAVMTPKQGRAEAISAFLDWQELGLVENLDAFKSYLVCERNATDVNRLDWLIQPDLVNQFRIAAVQIQFKL